MIFVQLIYIMNNDDSNRAAQEEVLGHRGVDPQQVIPDANASINERAARIQEKLSENDTRNLQMDYSKFRHGNISWEDFLVGKKERSTDTRGRLYDKFLSEAKATIAHIKKEAQQIIDESAKIGDVRVCNRDADITSVFAADKLFASMCAVSDFERKIRRYENDIATGSYSGTAEMGGKDARPLDIDSLSEMIAQLGKDQREIDAIKEFMPSQDEVNKYRKQNKFPSDQPLLMKLDIPKDKWPEDEIIKRDISQELTAKYNFPTTDKSVPLRRYSVSREQSSSTAMIIAVLVVLVVLVVFAAVGYFMFIKKESFDIIAMGSAAGMDMPDMMIELNDKIESRNKESQGKDPQMRALLGARGRMDNSHGAKEHFADCPCGCNNYGA